LKSVGLGVAGAVAAFVAGMAWTHRDTLPALPTFYPDCRSARAAGVAPIRRGEPGYRPAL